MIFLKKILSLSLGIIALCLFFLPSNVRADKIKVVTTTDFYGQVAEEVLGNKGKVTSIINNPSVDPHDYEPTTQTSIFFLPLLSFVIHESYPNPL